MHFLSWRGSCADYFWRCWLVSGNVFDAFCFIVTLPTCVPFAIYWLNFLWLRPSIPSIIVRKQTDLLFIHTLQIRYKFYTLKMSSGLLAATSSMSMPPWGLPTMTGPLQDRSIRMAKYVSLLMSRASATITWRWHSRSEKGRESNEATTPASLHFPPIFGNLFTLQPTQLNTVIQANMQGPLRVHHGRIYEALLWDNLLCCKKRD